VTGSGPEKDRWLLPDGIEEVLPGEARRIEALRRQLLDLFERWGYDLVMPPLIEYLEALLTGSGRDLDLATFKLTDQLTGRLMGVRADMTPQVARIDAHYLKCDEPMRLCYVGSVLRTRPEAFGGMRELMQLGAEIYGHPGPESDIEVVRLMLATLAAAGLARVHVDLGHVGVFRALAREAGLGAAEEAALFDALQRKAAPEVGQLLAAAPGAPATKQMLGMLGELNGGVEVLAQARQRLSGAPPAVADALAVLERVAGALQQSHPQGSLYIDLAELRGYRYYTGVVFAAYLPGQGQAVAKGGRYDGIGHAFGRARPATGFGADLRRLVRLVPETRAGARAICAPGDEVDAALEAEIARLRQGGERVVVALPGTPAPAACDRRLVRDGRNWKVVAL